MQKASARRRSRRAIGAATGPTDRETVGAFHERRARLMATNLGPGLRVDFPHRLRRHGEFFYAAWRQ